MSTIPPSEKRVEPLYIITAAVSLYRKYLFVALLIGLLISLSNLLPVLFRINGDLFIIFYLIFYIIISIIFLWYIDKREKGQEMSIFKAWQQVSGRIVLTTIVNIVVILIFVLGIALFVIPGIIWSIMYSQAVMYALFKNKRIFESLGLSAKVTKGNRFNIFIINALTTFPLAVILPLLYYKLNGTPVYHVIDFIFTLFSTAFIIFIEYLIWMSLQKIHKGNKELVES